MKFLARDKDTFNAFSVTPSYKQFIDYFGKHSRERTFYNMPRFYIGGINQNFNTHQMVSLTQNSEWYNWLESYAIEVLNRTHPGYNHVREAVSTVANKNTSGYEFFPTNFLDSLCLRVHVVLYGTMRMFIGDSGPIDVGRGDVLLFDGEDYGKKTMCNQAEPCAHQVFSISHETNRDKKTWDLFAKSKLYQEFL